MKERKRHKVVDILCLIIAAIVHIAYLNQGCTKLVQIFADGGYSWKLIDQAKTTFGQIFEIVKRNDLGFKIFPKRCVVERSLAWL